MPTLSTNHSASRLTDQLSWDAGYEERALTPRHGVLGHYNVLEQPALVVRLYQFCSVPTVLLIPEGRNLANSDERIQSSKVV